MDDLTFSYSTDYYDYVNPLMGDLLSALGIERNFIKAEGHTLHYLDSSGRQGTVLDLTMGYGSLLFGHNNPEILQVVQKFFQDKRPIHLQLTNKSLIGKFAKELSIIAKKYLGKEYIIRFANFGAEAVDLAVKHCEFLRVLKIQELLKNNSQKIIDLEPDFELNTIRISSSIFSQTELREQIHKSDLTPQELDPPGIKGIHSSFK